ncbi:MAG: peptide chain release factor 1 [Saprospiraceae bacterium]|nr:peptide chain release factor 1 [Bacteroidia bacterium]NNE16704.1 peptide chain release factor 1 [Saprospiraceae bacterium]NNL93725.1 peptide chain release factor 1 [Saprospiraceae bacterium]
MLDKLEAIYNHFLSIEEKLSDPEVVTDMKKFSKLNKEYKGMQVIVDKYKVYKDVIENIQNAKEMLSDPDPEMQAMAKEEIDILQPQKEALDEEIKVLLIPKDPDDKLDVVMEIRAGTGGDEASIFAGDLYRLYTKYCESQNWKVETVTLNEGSSGGYSKVVLEIFGDEVFGKLKFESGAHRVQRVPKTESQGRVHTSAATVVIMPKFELDEIDVKKDDLKVDTFRSSGAGGQHVNKTESGVRFTHLPTGIVSESTDSRSQHKNREIAMQKLYQRIKEAQREKAYSEQKQKRKSLVGTGDRSDKIRTYNYPQNRVTDHRINLTLYSLDKIMDGNITEIIEKLQMAENADKMVEA